MSKIEYGRYQMESHGVIICMIQNQKKNANVGFFFQRKQLSALVKLSSGEDYRLKLRFLQPVMAEQNISKGLSTMTEIKTKKSEAERWKKTEGPDEGVPFVFCDYH